MTTANEHLLSAIREKRPVVLVLGQDAWSDAAKPDVILAKALDKLELGKDSPADCGWQSLLRGDAVPPSFYEWLAERFQRRVHPGWLTVLGEVPWSAVFTTSVDPTLRKLFTGKGREPEMVLSSKDSLRFGRSRKRPPIFYLFGVAGSLEADCQPPSSRLELLTRQSQHTRLMLGRLLDAATSLGVIVVDGFASNSDWLRIDDILGEAGGATTNQILWFGDHPGPGVRDQEVFDSLVVAGKILVEPRRFGSVVAEFKALGQLPDLEPPESEEAGTVSFKKGERLETTPEERLSVEAVASIVDDSWTAFLPPLGLDAEYMSFRRFHGGLESTRLLAEGIRRRYAIERDFEQKLYQQVNAALLRRTRIDSPIIVHGQSGTGKSIALVRLAIKVRQAKKAAVLLASDRLPQAREISRFCEDAEKAGAEATLIVCDANEAIEPYRNLLLSLRSRGRRVVVLGSRYRFTDRVERNLRFHIEAPAKLSTQEQNQLISLLKRFFPAQSEPVELKGDHILACLYRALPSSRPRLSIGLGNEAIASEQEMRKRGSQIQIEQPLTQLAEQLIKAGLIDNYRPLFDDRQIEVLESEDAAGRIVDFVMVTGRLYCPVPVNLLVRAATSSFHSIDLPLITELISDFDLFRWEPANEEGSEFLLRPRLALEAQLICERRLGGPAKEAERLKELIQSVNSYEFDSSYPERDFLLKLLQQIKDTGPLGTRYKNSYVGIASALTDVRESKKLVDPRLVLQESVFRRLAVRHETVEDDQKLHLLEEARDAVQAAIDEFEREGTSRNSRIRSRLYVERAAVYSFLANDRDRNSLEVSEVWPAYLAARTAIRKAVNISDNYYPLDIGLWAPADLLEGNRLPEEEKMELKADILATFDQVDPENLSPDQVEKFNVRKVKVGQTTQNQKLTEEGYAELEKSGSTAGYYLKARELAPEPYKDKEPPNDGLFNEKDCLGAKKAADFLYAHFDQISQDVRCLALLLDCRWIAEMRRYPLRGERQPIPCNPDTRQEIRKITYLLNKASGDAPRCETRYLEAVLAWVMEDRAAASEIFHTLDSETEYVNSGRLRRRHWITDVNFSPRLFAGRVGRQRDGNSWDVHVHDINQRVILRESDFPEEEIAYGRTISRFAIGFNFTGPIATPLKKSK